MTIYGEHPPAQFTVSQQHIVGQQRFTASQQQLTASHLRIASFPTVRRGYQPDAVHAYLNRVAEEFQRLHQRLAAAYAEADRIKRGLRQWQTEHAATCRRDPDSDPQPGQPQPRRPDAQPNPDRDRQPDHVWWPINP